FLQSGFSSLVVCRVSIENDTSNLEQELQKMDLLLIRFQNRRPEPLKHLDDCKGLLAPIRRLPQEILLHIFS
ncbi:hypothetical protein IW262DRAFT_1231352, partial [Armillaria fumosa]